MFIAHVHRWISAALSLLLATQAAGGSAEQRDRPAPPERGLELLAIDFAAVTSDGFPVADLKAAEVTVKINGRTRPFRSLQLISVAEGPSAVAASPSSAASSPLPLPFGTNSISDAGRTLLLVLDDDSFRPGREGPLRAEVDRLLSRLSPRDRISLATMPYGGVRVPLTTDHSRIRTALSVIAGRAPASESGSELACRTRLTLEALAGHLNSLGVRETPAVVMFITGGLAGPRRDAPVTMAPGMCELTPDMFLRVGGVAGAARAQFYVIQPEDMMIRGGVRSENIAGAGFRGSDNAIEGIEHLAGITGGKMLNLTGSAVAALDRVLRESSAYYLAAIDPQASDRTGRSLRLEVRVARPGVEVRTRPEITFAKVEPVGARAAQPSPRDMLAVSTVFRDLPLRASAFSALEPNGQKLRVVTLAEAVDPNVKLGSLVAALFDRDGRLVSNWVATAADLQRSPVMGAVTAEPGAYRLRVAAIDTDGRSGTADYDVMVELVQTGPLKLSSVVLGLSRDGAFVPKLQFGAEPVAIGQVEIYTGSAGAGVSAVIELAATLNGPAIVAMPLAITRIGDGRFVATGALPIGALPPGDYIVRALVGAEGHPPTRVVRTLRKTIPAR